MWFASQVTELLLRNRASVSQAQFFRAPCRKNYTLDRKMDDTFFDGHDELYHHAKFGEDRTARAGCRCGNMVIVCFFVILSRSEAGALFVRGWYNLNRCCVAVFCSILMTLITSFQHWLPFRMHYVVLIFVARWRHKFHEIAPKNFEKSKNRRKRLCARLRIDSWGIGRKFHCSSLGPRM